MDVLIIGYSNIAHRRVIPALVQSQGVGCIHIASSRTGLQVDIPTEKKGSIIAGYQLALDQLSPCLAYVSLPNHLHGYWVKKALQRGFHVVVDKPAFLSETELEEALAIADEKGLCLAEAVVWPFHDQIAVLRQSIGANSKKLRAIQCVFSMPPLPSQNFRNDPARGGGAFNDLAAYAVTPGRVFFGEPPLEVACRILSRSQVTRINTGFSFEAIFTGGRIFQGFYGFSTEYRNSLLLLGDEFSAQLQPAFTLAPSAATTISIFSQNRACPIDVPGGDMFRAFLDAVILSIESGDYARWTDILRQDAKVYFNAKRISGEMT